MDKIDSEIRKTRMETIERRWEQDHEKSNLDKYSSDVQQNSLLGKPALLHVSA